MFNYAQSDLSDYPTTPNEPRRRNEPDADFPAKNGFDGATIRGFGMRAQVDF